MVPKCPICGSKMERLGDSWICLVCEPFDE